jgi:hypothetical protein
MRILSYEVKPAIALKFAKDGADNFFVRSDESSASGTYRLVFFADADAGYFAPSLPVGGATYTPAVVRAMAPPELKPVLPDAVLRNAKITLDKLDVDPQTSLAVAFNKLVAHFRAFTAKPMTSTGDIYRDLCDSQAGVCRHRSFAFMITANALGIPTRFVQNEAHAFVEVWFPERGWQRIDLGGAALRMEVTGAENKTLHRPRAEDPFAKPNAYKNNYTQLEGDIGGLSQQQIADKHKPLDQSPPSGDFAGNNGGGGGPGADDSNTRILPQIDLPAAEMDPKKKSPRLEITQADTSAYRGDVVHIEGRAHVLGKALPDHPVDVFLAPAGRHGAGSYSLGRAVTDAAGMFRQDFNIPGQLNLATYEIWLSSPPDAYFNPALSD